MPPAGGTLDDMTLPGWRPAPGTSTHPGRPTRTRGRCCPATGRPD